MERRKEPRFDLCRLAELVSFGGPDVEGLLGEVLRIGFRAGEAKRESEKRFVMFCYERFELLVWIWVRFHV